MEWMAGWPAPGSHSRYVAEPRSLNRGYFQCEAIEKLFNEHRDKHRDNYDRIWRLLNLEMWHESVWKTSSTGNRTHGNETGVG